jgi:hypothetical protein
MVYPDGGIPDNVDCPGDAFAASASGAILNDPAGQADQVPGPYRKGAAGLRKRPAKPCKIAPFAFSPGFRE